MSHITSSKERFVIITFLRKTSSTVHLKKSDEAGLCVGDFSLQESCFISPRKRAENSEERNTGRGQEDEKKTLKRLRHRFAAGEKDFFIVVLFFCWRGRGIRGQRRRRRFESSNSMPPSQTHHRRHLEKVIERWDPEIERRSRNRTLRENPQI